MQDVPDTLSGRGKGQPVQAGHALGLGSCGMALEHKVVTALGFGS